MCPKINPNLENILKLTHTGNLNPLKTFHASNPTTHWTYIRYPNNGDTVLHIASRLGHTHIIRYILESYTPASIDFRNNDNKTALHEAAQFAQLESAQMLLENGADVNALKKADWTPLMLACTKIQPASVDMVALLIKHGAILNYANKDGWTALHLTVREGSVDVLNLLISNGIKTNVITKNKRTASHIAVLHGNLEVLNCLPCDFEAVDSCGNNLMHEAALSGDLNVFRSILRTGCNFKATNKCGLTVLHMAAGVGALDIIKEVVEVLNINVNVKSAAGLTPLHCAVKNLKFEASDLLLQYGVEKIDK